MPTPPPVVRAVVLAWGGLFLLDLVLGMYGAGLAGALAMDPLALLRLDPAALPGALAYVAVHAGFLHVLLNAWVFLLFAPEIEVLLPGRRMAVFLGRAAVAGLLVSLLLAWLLPERFGAPVLGGSGLAAAALAAHAAIYPGRRLHFFVIQFSVRTLFLVVLALDVLGLIAQFAGQPGGTAYAVHLAGTAVGWQAMGGFGRLEGPFRRWADARRRKHSEKQRQQARADDAEEDRILAKISREGISALTTRERDFLKRRSEQRRGG